MYALFKNTFMIQIIKFYIFKCKNHLKVKKSTIKLKSKGTVQIRLHTLTMMFQQEKNYQCFTVQCV